MTSPVLPSDPHAERILLSCCLLDSAKAYAQCSAAGIVAESFYHAPHRLIFGCFRDLAKSCIRMDHTALTGELTHRRQLEAVGGAAFLAHLALAAPPTANAEAYIKAVQAAALKRRLITMALGYISSVQGADDIHQITQQLGQQLSALCPPSPPVENFEMSWDQLLQFRPDQDPDCLMGNRFLCRTGACVIVAPSGVGKSVLATQWSGAAALGRPFFGLRTAFPLRILYVQAEDDIGDVAEMVQGMQKGLPLSPADIARLKSQMRIVRWNDVTRESFFARLRLESRGWPFDLLVMNPMFSYCGCSVSDQEKLTLFLRNGLNPILNETRAAALIVHHTNKPPTDANGKTPAREVEERYAGSGSAELTNWARAYVVLTQVTAAGPNTFKLKFVKRGQRAGLLDVEGNPTTSVLIQHSSTGVCWEPSGYVATNKGPDGKFTRKFDLVEALKAYDATANWSTNEKLIAAALKVSTRTVRTNRRAIMEMVGP
jgi:hypothetical protein